MGTQLCGEAIRADSFRRSSLAVVLLLALWPVAAAQALPFRELASTGSMAAAATELLASERALRGSPVTGPDLTEIEFGPAGFTVTGPLSFAYGEPGGIVFCFEFSLRDPAYLVTGASLFGSGAVSGRAGRRRLGAMLRTLPNLGVVPSADLPAFDTGAVDPIFWDLREFDCGILALRVDQYLALRGSLVADEIEGELTASWIRPHVRVVPEPTPALLIGQGVMALALRGSRRVRARCAACADG
jgi:hypothetical protein